MYSIIKTKGTKYIKKRIKKFNYKKANIKKEYYYNIQFFDNLSFNFESIFILIFLKENNIYYYSLLIIFSQILILKC